MSKRIISFTIVFILGAFIGGRILTYISNQLYLSSIELSAEEENRVQLAHTKVELSRALKNIEFYKLIYGKYPTDIQQIQPLTFLRNTDPYAPRDICIYEFYYYLHQDLGEYVLISMGQDQDLFTEDDVYPDVPSSDKTNIGLLRQPIIGYKYPVQECLPF